MFSATLLVLSTYIFRNTFLNFFFSKSLRKNKSFSHYLLRRFCYLHMTINYKRKIPQVEGKHISGIYCIKTNYNLPQLNSNLHKKNVLSIRKKTFYLQSIQLYNSFWENVFLSNFSKSWDLEMHKKKITGKIKVCFENKKNTNSPKIMSNEKIPL
jgi:hypothetical protein